jgi:hypothetical protein
MKFYHKYGFEGVYSMNKLNKIPVSDNMSFIVNLSPNYTKNILNGSKYQEK